MTGLCEKSWPGVPTKVSRRGGVYFSVAPGREWPGGAVAAMPAAYVANDNRLLT